MDGFFSIWSRPSAHFKKDGAFFLEDYELLTLILSVCTWKRFNGKMFLYADSVSSDFLKKTECDFLFDDIYDLRVDEDINPTVFWAAGKLFALRDLRKNAAMVDLDLIVWKDLSDFVSKGDVVAIHREEIRPEVYPSLDFFKFNNGYELDRDYSESELPINTAFLYIADDTFRIKYAETAIEFMKNCAEERENLKHMVFAEQRLLPILAAKYGKTIHTMFDLGQNIGYQEYFTHIWGHKNILKYNYSEKVVYCKRVMARIKNDYPEVYGLIKDNKLFQEYA